MKKYIGLVALFFCFIAGASAQGFEGTWKTIDDETGEAKSYVTIYEEDGKYFGQVTSILNEAKKDAVCDKCKGDKKDQAIQDMIIVRDMNLVRDDALKGGKILDPNKGKEYKCEIYLKNDGQELKVKGCIGPVCRGQVWYRVS